MWNKLDYSPADFENFKDVLTSGGGSGSTTVSDSKRVAFCSWLAANKPSSCGTDPGASTFTPDGCSISYPGSSTWNSLFNSACNGHDTCYSSMGAIKSDCDNALKRETDFACMEREPDPDKNEWWRNTKCGLASKAYYAGVSNPIGSYFFYAAQSGLGCVGWHAIRKKYCAG